MKRTLSVLALAAALATPVNAQSVREMSRVYATADTLNDMLPAEVKEFNAPLITTISRGETPGSMRYTQQIALFPDEQSVAALRTLEADATGLHVLQGAPIEPYQFGVSVQSASYCPGGASVTIDNSARSLHETKCLSELLRDCTLNSSVVLPKKIPADTIELSMQRDSLTWDITADGITYTFDFKGHCRYAGRD